MSFSVCVDSRAVCVWTAKNQKWKYIRGVPAGIFATGSGFFGPKSGFIGSGLLASPICAILEKSDVDRFRFDFFFNRDLYISESPSPYREFAVNFA